jgi:hypothetical protein
MANKTLQDFKDIVANQNPNWTQKKINAEATKRLNAQIAANNNSNTGGGNIPDTSTDVKLRKIKSGKRTDWDAFTNGQIVRVPSSTKAGVTTEAFVGQAVPGSTAQPIPIALVQNGEGFELKDLDSAINEYLANIPNTPDAYEYAKFKLQQYYPSTKAFERSLTQPIRESDAGFRDAIKAAISDNSSRNFDEAFRYANTRVVNPAAPLPGLYTTERFIETRQVSPQDTSSGQRTSSLTFEADARKEFDRTVQLYVGDPKLVDNIDALRDKYVADLAKEERLRQSIYQSTTNALGTQSFSTGLSYQQLGETDKLEMRLKLITKGNAKAKSTGISLVDPVKLQDSGGLIGDTYTKLTEYAYDYGIQLPFDVMLKRASEALLPGGVDAGTDTKSGLDQQKRTLAQMSKAKYTGLSSYLDSGLTVSDLAADFRKTKEEQLELAPGSVDIFDEDVQSAITGEKGMIGKFDYILNLRSKPEWRFTKAANEAAAGFLDTIARTWGVYR